LDKAVKVDDEGAVTEVETGDEDDTVEEDFTVEVVVVTWTWVERCFGSIIKPK
jgi:hypothetical protein